MWARGKSEFFLIETQLEEKHVCLCLLVLCSMGKKKVKHAPSRVCLHTQALNGEQVGRCRDEGWRGARERLPIIARVHRAAMSRCVHVHVHVHGCSRECPLTAYSHKQTPVCICAALSSTCPKFQIDAFWSWVWTCFKLKLPLVMVRVQMRGWEEKIKTEKWKSFFFVCLYLQNA